MDEMKLLIDMVGKLPQTALWVLLGFFLYKVIYVGSVFGVLKILITKIHDVFIDMSEKSIERSKIEKGLKVIDVVAKMNEITISAEVPKLIKQISRLVNTRTDCGSSYIHSRDVEWLKEAIDEKIAREVKTG